MKQSNTVEAYYEQILVEAMRSNEEPAKSNSVVIEGVYGTLGGNATYASSEDSTFKVTGIAASALVN